jgi:hypothetical protein
MTSPFLNAALVECAFAKGVYTFGSVRCASTVHVNVTRASSRLHSRADFATCAAYERPACRTIVASQTACHAKAVYRCGALSSPPSC